MPTNKLQDTQLSVSSITGGIEATKNKTDPITKIILPTTAEFFDILDICDIYGKN